MWDNWRCLHRGLPFDDLRFRRYMQRATVQDVANSCEQEGLDVPAVAAADLAEREIFITRQR